MSELSHREAERIAADLEMGLVDAADRLRLEMHLERCAVCAAREARLRGARAVLREAPVGKLDATLLASAQLAARRSEGPAAAPRRWTAVLAAAAAALVIGGVGIVALVQGPTLASDEPCPGVLTARGEGAVYVVHRSEASRCELEVERGEVHLEVDPTATTVVEISAGDLVARVLGTVLSVAVDARGNGAVTVERGRVEVTRRGERVLVGAGEVTRAVGGGLSLAAPAEARSLAALRASFALSEVPAESGARSDVEEVDDRAFVQDQRAVADLTSFGDAADRSPEAETAEQVARAEASEASASASAPSSERALPMAREGARDGAREGARVEGPRAEGGRVEVAALRRLVAAGRTAEVREQVTREEARAQSISERAELWTVVAESYAADGAHARSLDAYLRAAESGRSSTARLALLSAAEVALDRLNEPGRALGLYDAYLRVAHRSALSEVASLGRCRALHELGRRAESRTCAEALLATSASGPVRRGAERLLR